MKSQIFAVIAAMVIFSTTGASGKDSWIIGEVDTVKKAVFCPSKDDLISLLTTTRDLGYDAGAGVYDKLTSPGADGTVECFFAPNITVEIIKRVEKIERVEDSEGRRITQYVIEIHLIDDPEQQPVYMLSPWDAQEPGVGI